MEIETRKRRVDQKERETNEEEKEKEKERAKKKKSDDEEVEEFFDIVRRMRVAVKHFEKSTADRNMRRRGRVAAEEGLVDGGDHDDGSFDGGDCSRNNGGLDLNLEPYDADRGDNDGDDR